MPEAYIPLPERQAPTDGSVVVRYLFMKDPLQGRSMQRLHEASCSPVPLSPSKDASPSCSR
jgi:hypothetical protein